MRIFSQLLCRAKSGQSLVEKGKAAGRVGVKRSSTFDRNSARVANILKVAEERFVVGVFAEIMRPDAPLGIREVEMYDLMLRGLDDSRILVLLAQVEKIKDHTHVRMFHHA